MTAEPLKAELNARRADCQNLQGRLQEVEDALAAAQQQVAVLTADVAQTRHNAEGLGQELQQAR